MKPVWQSEPGRRIGVVVLGTAVGMSLLIVAVQALILRPIQQAPVAPDTVAVAFVTLPEPEPAHGPSTELEPAQPPPTTAEPEPAPSAPPSEPEPEPAEQPRAETLESTPPPLVEPPPEPAPAPRVSEPPPPPAAEPPPEPAPAPQVSGPPPPPTVEPPPEPAPALQVSEPPPPPAVEPPREPAPPPRKVVRLHAKPKPAQTPTQAPTSALAGPAAEAHREQAPVAAAQLTAPAESSQRPPGPAGGTSGARAIEQPMPEIPPELRRYALSLVAVVKFTIAADGAAKAELAEATPDPRLNRALLEAFRRWRFFPAMQDGKPISSVLVLRVPIRVE